MNICIYFTKGQNLEGWQMGTFCHCEIIKLNYLINNNSSPCPGLGPLWTFRVRVLHRLQRPKPQQQDLCHHRPHRRVLFTNLWVTWQLIEWFISSTQQDRGQVSMILHVHEVLLVVLWQPHGQPLLTTNYQPRESQHCYCDVEFFLCWHCLCAGWRHFNVYIRYTALAGGI